MNNLLETGRSLETASKVAIMVHGRGSTAAQIVTLADHLDLGDFAILAPQAPTNTWYPYSFMAPRKENQPYLDQALEQMENLVKKCLDVGKSADQLYFIGFSQGACLVLEYTARNAKKYGGIIAFTGGLIGEDLNPDAYTGDFKQTPVFIGSSHKDMHVPLHRVEESEKVFRKSGAQIKTLIFPDTYHTIREKEIDWVNNHLLSTAV